MALLLRTNGTVERLEPGPGGLSLDQLRAAIGGGAIEVVTLGGTSARREVLVVDEDGLRKQLPVNEMATTIYRGGFPPRHREVIVGDALLAEVLHGGTDEETWR